MSIVAFTASTQPSVSAATSVASKAQSSKTPVGGRIASDSAPVNATSVSFSQTLAQAERPTKSIYTSMTPAQMKGVAQDLYNSGKIDLDQLFKLQNAGVLGKQGPNGEFIPLSAAEKARFDNTPVNYIQLAQGAMKYIEQTGAAADPKSGYADWQDILETLQNPASSHAPRT